MIDCIVRRPDLKQKLAEFLTYLAPQHEVKENKAAKRTNDTPRRIRDKAIETTEAR